MDCINETPLPDWAQPAGGSNRRLEGRRRELILKFIQNHLQRVNNGQDSLEEEYYSWITCSTKYYYYLLQTYINFERAVLVQG